MRHGPIIGAGALFSLACSWAALVMAPQLQLGALAPAPLPNSTEIYPPARPGLAAQGAEVYRSLGCNQCHTRAVRQEQALYGVRLTAVGSKFIDLAMPGTGTTNLVNLAVPVALAKVRRDLRFAELFFVEKLPVFPAVLSGNSDAMAAVDGISAQRTEDFLTGVNRPQSGPTVSQVLADLPAEILVKVGVEEAERGVRLLSDAGAKAELTFYNIGPDLDRGWGARRAVAQDYVNDSPVLLGGVRVGPDLAGIGTRAPEKFAAPWKFATTNKTEELERHLLVHLYNPRLLAKDSICPTAGYLFDTKKPEARYAGEPLTVPGKDTPVYPKHNARALVAYLLTQRADVGVAEAPVPSAPKAASAAPVGTNAPAKP